MHANILMLHIVHNVWQISDLMEWKNTWNIFFFLNDCGQGVHRLLNYAWVLSEYVLQMHLYHIILTLLRNILHYMMWSFTFHSLFLQLGLNWQWNFYRLKHCIGNCSNHTWKHIHRLVNLLLYMLAGRKSSGAPLCSRWHARSCGAPVCSGSWIPVWWCSPWGGPLETPLDGGHMVQRWRTPDSLWCPSCVCST